MEKPRGGDAYYPPPGMPVVAQQGVPAAGAGYYPPPGMPMNRQQGVPLSPVPGAPAGFQVQGGYQHRTTWSTGLCDCFDDVSNCCMTCWCPCITFGQIAEIVGRGGTSCGTSCAIYYLLCSLTGCHWIYSCIYRSNMRQQYGLPDTPCCDCFLHCCCEQCALCQEYRELKSRGYNVELGWHGNIEMFTRNQTVPPIAQPGMIR